jgi:hypothetical protein
VKIRFYGCSDLEEITRLHAAQGLAYTLPDLETPEFIVRAVLERDDGSIAAGVFLRKTAETYLIAGGKDRKREKIGQLLLLHKEIAGLAEKHGLSDVHCILPPELLKKAGFGDLLMHLGWERPEWTLFTRKV